MASKVLAGLILTDKLFLTVKNSIS